MKYLTLILIIPFFISLPPVWGSVVLIDPGHGGDENGATNEIEIVQAGKKEKVIVREKDISLQLALKVQEKLARYHNVYLTRSIDRTLTLQERADIAEKVKADLFISIHLNSGVDKSSHGIETYYLNNHDNKAIKKVESVENQSLHGTDLEVNQILIDLVVQKTAPTSKELSYFIHSRLKSTVAAKFRMVDRGIRAGLFYVLALSKRPSILIEAGFLSNQQEVTKLLNPKFQDDFASAIVLGINDFLKKSKNFKSNLIL